MRTLIAYATRSGASRECAELLASEIGDCEICDLDATVPNVADFDTVVVGTGIRVGRAYKPFKKFVNDNADALMAKNISFFLCCLVMKEFNKAVAANIPEALRNAAFRVSAFGGKPLIGGKKDQKWMLKDEVSAFAKAVKERA
jgi:menaquinone-dependent protoporphyrinogen oxidase